MYYWRNHAREMTKLLYSPTSEVSIEGASEELLAIKARILSLADVGAGTIEVSGDFGNPSPYELSLERLVISSGSGPIQVSVGTKKRDLNIIANPECMRVLASFFNVPEGAQSGWHTHLEFYPENQWIAEDSEPTIISLRMHPVMARYKESFMTRLNARLRAILGTLRSRH
jgi:hypothetical protein